MEPALRATRNFDHPDALDWDLLLDHLRALARDRAIPVPIYDFKTHLRLGVRRFDAPKGPLIVEGMFVLHRAEVREMLDLSVFIDVPQAERLERRLARDTRERGRSPEAVREQHARNVEPMYRRYVLPTMHLADLVLDGRRPLTENTESVAAAAGMS